MKYTIKIPASAPRRTYPQDEIKQALLARGLSQEDVQLIFSYAFYELDQDKLLHGSKSFLNPQPYSDYEIQSVLSKAKRKKQEIIDIQNKVSYARNYLNKYMLQNGGEEIIATISRENRTKMLKQHYVTEHNMDDKDASTLAICVVLQKRIADKAQLTGLKIHSGVERVQLNEKVAPIPTLDEWILNLTGHNNHIPRDRDCLETYYKTTIAGIAWGEMDKSPSTIKRHRKRAKELFLT